MNKASLIPCMICLFSGFTLINPSSVLANNTPEDFQNILTSVEQSIANYKTAIENQANLIKSVESSLGKPSISVDSPPRTQNKTPKQDKVAVNSVKDKNHQAYALNSLADENEIVVPTSPSKYKDTFLYQENIQNGGNMPKVSGSVSKSIMATEYYLGPNDVLQINVIDAPEFSHQEVKVPPNGKINVFPLLNYNVTGETIEELQRNYTEALKSYYNDPKVSILLKESKPFIVYVSGAVVKPGSFEFNTASGSGNYNIDGSTGVELLRKSPILSNVIVATGGVKYDADLENVRIRNYLTGKVSKVDLIKLIAEGDLTQDYYLTYGDSVHVPRLPSSLAVDDKAYQQFASSSMSQNDVPIRVMGYVNQPGLVILDTKLSLNINSAISSAGGYQGASPYPPKVVYLSRVDQNGYMVTTAINPQKNDMTLRPNDLIYVPDKTKPIVGRAFDYLARVIAPFNLFAETYNNTALMFHPRRMSDTFAVKSE